MNNEIEKIYILTEGGYSDYAIKGVFLDKAEAERLAKKFVYRLIIFSLFIYSTSTLMFKVELEIIIFFIIDIDTAENPSSYMKLIKNTLLFIS